MFLSLALGQFLLLGRVRGGLTQKKARKSKTDLGLRDRTARKRFWSVQKMC